MTTNHYVAWYYFHADKIARYQGFAESLEEFKAMCSEKGFDLSGVDEFECVKEDARDAIGHPCKKNVTQD